MNGRYQGKRFAAFLLVALALCIGFFAGNTENFGNFAMYLSAAYGAYLTGQSATDWQKAKNGG